MTENKKSLPYTKAALTMVEAKYGDIFIKG